MGLQLALPTLGLSFPSGSRYSWHPHPGLCRLYEAEGIQLVPKHGSADALVRQGFLASSVAVNRVLLIQGSSVFVVESWSPRSMPAGVGDAVMELGSSAWLLPDCPLPAPQVLLRSALSAWVPW